MEIEKGDNAPLLADCLATETSKGAHSKAQFQARITRYGKAKSTALAVADYIRSESPDQSKLYHRIQHCGDHLVFRHYYTEDQIRLSHAKFCMKHLLCPLCAIRRGAKLLGRYLDRFEALKAENGSLRAYMVTFTVKDGPDLKERFNHLQKSLKYYHKLRHAPNRACEAKKAEGAVWSYEIKRGKNSDLWHPHAHAIWLCSTPPDQSTISKQWHDITKDSFIVDVREIDQVEPVTGFLEVFKYAVKFSDQPLPDTWHCFQTLTGKRLIGSFGSFYGIPEPDDLLDDPLEGKPFVEYFFQFVGGSYKSSQHSTIKHREPLALA